MTCPKYRLVLNLGLTLISANAILDQDLLNPVLGKRDAPSSSSCLPTKYRRASPILRIASDSTAFNNPIQTIHREATNMAHTPMDVSDQIERSTTSEPSENDGIEYLRKVETVGVSDNTNVVRVKGKQLESEMPLWKVQLNQEIS